MVILIVLNIILIVAVIFFALYLIKNKKDEEKNVNPVCVDCEVDDDIEKNKYKRKKESKPERVFIGKFITDEEYHQMTKNRKSDISILLEEVNREYEYLKELKTNERTEGNNTR